MRLSAQSPYIWRQLNEFVKGKLGSSNNVYVYRGLHQAVFETLISMHLRFAHKRKIVAQTGLGDHLSQIELELARMGVRVKGGFEEDLQKEEKSCLAYVQDIDDALTGELYNNIETLKLLSSHKIHRIHVAHHLFKVRQSFVKNLSEFDIIIAALDSNYALVFAGDKVILPSLVVSQLPWSLENDLPKLDKLIDQKAKLFQPEITQFETALPEGVRAWFREQPARRIYDRSVVVMKNHDGAAMMDLLKKSLKIDGTPFGADNLIETTSLCRWENDVWYQQAESLGLTREQLQGTVIIDGKVINTAFSQMFKGCVEQLEQLSR